MKQEFKGGQCGKVRYRVSLELNYVIACNCSRGGKLGSLLAFAPFEDFALISGEQDVSEYLFNKHIIHHFFCKTCGIESFARGIRPDGAKMVAVNVRCLDDVDLDSLPVKTFDGRSL